MLQGDAATSSACTDRTDGMLSGVAKAALVGESLQWLQLRAVLQHVATVLQPESPCDIGGCISMLEDCTHQLVVNGLAHEGHTLGLCARKAVGLPNCQVSQL